MPIENKYIVGRLQVPTDRLVEEFGASVSFDYRLAEHDIAGSIAHASMLAKCSIISAVEAQLIKDGLRDILHEINNGDFVWSVQLEDVHMNIEAALVAKIGNVGKKLHTGRSRNDQVATDIRLWLRAKINAIVEQIEKLQFALLQLAEQEADTIMPGFTHLQVAQPVSFGHHMLAWRQMLTRDQERLEQCRTRMNQMPLGAAALAGTTFAIDRAYTSDLLGFDQPCENSLDAVSDRDFAIEFCADCALLMTHLSRFSEEIILWMSAQFNFIELADGYCTGSSIMPQKKNPDVPELVRGKTGRVNGHLISLLTLMKSQPLAYNKDNQEDKEPLFDTADTVLSSLTVYTGMMSALKVNRENMHQAAVAGFSTATDLADYLVRKGLTFRDAHSVVGKTVAWAIDKKMELAKIPLANLQQFSAEIDEDVYNILSVEGSIAARNHLGGTAPIEVKRRIRQIKEYEK